MASFMLLLVWFLDENFQVLHGHGLPISNDSFHSKSSQSHPVWKIQISPETTFARCSSQLKYLLGPFLRHIAEAYAHFCHYRLSKSLMFCYAIVDRDHDELKLSKHGPRPPTRLVHYRLKKT